MQINPDNWESAEVPFENTDWQACIQRSVFIPTDIFEDSRGDVWIGTVSNGLLHYSAATGKIETIEGTPAGTSLALRKMHKAIYGQAHNTGWANMTAP